MVWAGCPAFSEKTFAARPVGAMSCTFCPSRTSVLTKVLANSVFPVPAEPRRIITLRSVRSERNVVNVCIAAVWSPVGSKPNICVKC